MASSDYGLEVLDYRIDRPRVVAIRFDPPRAVMGTTVAVDALALAPRGTPVDAVTARTCVLADGLQTEYYDLSCFAAPELAVPLGPVPANLSFPVEDCPADTGGTTVDYGGYTAGSGYGAYTSPCASQRPVLVEADAGGSAGFGHVYASAVASEPSFPSLWEAERHLTWTGEPAAGGEVDLTYRIQSIAITTDPGFTWYVDAGELLGTGRTAPWTPDEAGWSRTGNTLRIPDDWHGPLRVVVVASDTVHQPSSANTAWDVAVLEVP